MPVYLLHGFRWPREGFHGIRVRAIVHDLEDCSVDYIQNVNSATELLRSFRTEFPEIMKELESINGRTLQFLEQHDPDDTKSEDSVCQPFAFVADRVVVMADMQGTSNTTLVHDEAGKKRDSPEPKRLSGNLAKVKLASTSRALSSALSVNLEDVIAEGPGLTAKAWDALADLRDKIAEGEKIGWWVVYNGDPLRSYEASDDGDDDEESDDGTEHEQVVGRPNTADTEQMRAVAPGSQAPSGAALANAHEEKEVATTSRATQRLSREMPPPTSIPPRKASKRASTGMPSKISTQVPPQPQQEQKQEREQEREQQLEPPQQSPIATSPQSRTSARTEGLKKFFSRKSSSST